MSEALLVIALSIIRFARVWMLAWSILAVCFSPNQMARSVGLGILLSYVVQPVGLIYTALRTGRVT